MNGVCEWGRVPDGRVIVAYSYMRRQPWPHALKISKTAPFGGIKIAVVALAGKKKEADHAAATGEAAAAGEAEASAAAATGGGGRRA